LANPQPDKFTKISTELLEALCRIRIPGEAMQVLLFIIRKTYGYKKKDDYISGSQISQATGIVRQNVVRALDKLKKMNLIYVIKNDSPMPSTIGIKKDYEKWCAAAKRVINIDSPKKAGGESIMIQGVNQKRLQSVIKKDSHNRYIDKNIKRSEQKFDAIKNEYAEAFYILHFFAATMDATERKRYLPKKGNSKAKLNWLNTIKLLHTADGFSWWEIFDVIKHARVDDCEPTNGSDFCWKDNVLTVPALRSVSRSQGIPKFHVIHKQIEKELSPPQKMTDLEYITNEMEKYAKE
jgi:phage replication O-like protein O